MHRSVSGTVRPARWITGKADVKQARMSARGKLRTNFRQMKFAGFIQNTDTSLEGQLLVKETVCKMQKMMIVKFTKYQLVENFIDQLKEAADHVKRTSIIYKGF